ncbi:hypothetical protein B566_EDAN001124 [Ephemera danica]|nr:hypothetical protein B566_EDAN001124 [Ephemera danica]
MSTEQFTRGPASSGILSPVEIWAIMARIDPNPQESVIPSLPVGLSAQTRARVRLPTPVRRPEGTVVRRRTVKSSQLMRHVNSQSDFMMDLSVSDNVVLTGISFCTQIPGVEEYARGRPAPPDVYTEELRVQTNFKGILPYNGVATIALSKPVSLTRSKGYSIAVTLARAGDYPLSILSPREFHSGIAFRFEDFAQFGDRQNLSQDLGFILGVVFNET